MKHTLILKSHFILLLSLWGWETGFSQSVNLGNPPVQNFSRQHFKAGTQIWDMAQGKNGVMWMANNDGLLEFDGTHWRLYPLGNGTIVRSVQVGPDDFVYAGGQGDFGYYAPDQLGQMQYHSLRLLLPEAERQFGDVWDVMARAEGVFFRTDNQVFHYHEQQVNTLFPPGKRLLFMGEWGDKLLVQDSDFLLYIFENGRLRPLGSPAAFRHGTISATLAIHPDTILVTTIKDGIFFCSGSTFEPWITPNDAFLKTNRIFCAGLLADGKIALGTSLNGLVTLDRHRRIYQHINKKSGLQNNTVLSLFAPRNGLWLGLDNGADFVDLGSPFTILFPDGELQGTGYAVQVYGGKIYFGTNTGLYATDWKTYYPPEERQKFAMVKNSGGQVWSLNVLEGDLLMGHHEGAFAVQGLEARQMTKLQGIWRFLSWSPGIAIAGHYSGLAAFKKSASGWTFDTTLSGFSESSRILARTAGGKLWMAHPYRGIYRLQVDPARRSGQAEYFDARQGLPSDLGNHLFQLGEEIVFVGVRGVYNFDERQRRFVPNTRFNQIFGEQTRVKYLRQDDTGNIWYVTDRETGVLLVENNTLEKNVRRVPIPELNDKLTGGFQFLLPADAHNVFVATGQGFIHFDPSAYTATDSVIRLVLHDVRLKNGQDSLLFGGYPKGSTGLRNCTLSSRQNSLIFSFSAPDYPGNEFIRYAHYLEGIEQKWSDWSTETDVAFSHLPWGHYTFRVKARNQHRVESPVLSFSFTILPPWYASRLAYFLYVALLLGVVAGIIYRQHRRFEQEKQAMQNRHQDREAQHQLKARQSEEAINRLQNEKLEAEVTHKTQELASVTMHLVHKNEILNTIQEALDRLQGRVAAFPELKKEIGQIIKVMEQDASIDADWEHFSHNFDQVHSDFLKRIGEQFPHLGPNDFKLCAYLRMNLSSKEIATLLNISVRGVEASRYRLRKRLGLDTETNLTEFLMRY